MPSKVDFFDSTLCQRDVTFLKATGRVDYTVEPILTKFKAKFGNYDFESSPVEAEPIFSDQDEEGTHDVEDTSASQDKDSIIIFDDE